MPRDTPKSFLYPGGYRYQTAGVRPMVQIVRGREYGTRELVELGVLSSEFLGRGTDVSMMWGERVSVAAEVDHETRTITFDCASPPEERGE